MMKKKLLPLVLTYTVLTLFLLFEPIMASAGGLSNAVLNKSATSKKLTVAFIGITGKVTDEKGVGLPGVSVAEKGTRNAVVTNTSGGYTINVANNNAVLVFTSVGYKPVEITVNGKTVVNVAMEAVTNALNEVIVTALGIKREAKSLGYAAQKADVQALQTNRTTNLANALEGQVAGLDVSPPAAGPGGSTKIRLRGQSSFTADNSPLIVINGLPMSQGASSSNGYTQNVDQGDNLQGINQDDIESMTVLKGSTAAALYGSRAVNGAIIITTKSGSKNTGIGIDFNSNFTINQALDFTDRKSVV